MTNRIYSSLDQFKPTFVETTIVYTAAFVGDLYEKTANLFGRFFEKKRY